MENGISQKANILPRWYASAWWAVAVWNAVFQFNVLASTQQYGFSLPLAPDLGKTLTPYAVASVGGIGGGILLAAVAIGLRYHAIHVAAKGNGWLKRVPVISRGLDGTPLTLLQIFVLLVAIAFPMAAQIHFVDTYLSGTSTYLGHIYADSWRGHLFSWPPHNCFAYVYDGKEHASYCEFFEPWAVVLCAAFGILTAGYALWAVFRTQPRHLLPVAEQGSVIGWEC